MRNMLQFQMVPLQLRHILVLPYHFLIMDCNLEAKGFTGHSQKLTLVAVETCVTTNNSVENLRWRMAIVD